jgi:hypothetical protein
MPVSAEDVREKFRGLAGQVLPRGQVDSIERTVFDLPNVDEITTLTRSLALAP